MSVIRRLAVDARVQALVTIIVEIGGHAALRVGQVGKNGSLAQFEDLRFQARPPALGLRVIVAVTAAALRAHSLVVVQQVSIGVAAVLPAPVRMNYQARSRRLGIEGAL